MRQPTCGGILGKNNWCPLSARFFIYVSSLVLCSVFLHGADLQAGQRAYEQKDYDGAMKELAPLAQEGKVEAQILLGKMYMLGQGVPKNTDAALKWFRAAADKGNAEAQFFLGAMYLLPARDIPQGLKWLRLSAEQGTPDAQVLLGMAYLKGTELPHDLVAADMWLHLAASKGDKFAPTQCEVAERQMTPDQIAKARTLATEWKAKAPASPSND
jgi:TPR repeat protein